MYLGFGWDLAGIWLGFPVQTGRQSQHPCMYACDIGNVNAISGTIIHNLKQLNTKPTGHHRRSAKNAESTFMIK